MSVTIWTSCSAVPALPCRLWNSCMKPWKDPPKPCDPTASLLCARATGWSEDAGVDTTYGAEDEAVLAEDGDALLQERDRLRAALGGAEDVREEAVGAEALVHVERGVGDRDALFERWVRGAGAQARARSEDERGRRMHEVRELPHLC